MSGYASLALGTIQAGANRFPVLWGLLERLRRQGIQVQPFRPQAELASSPGAEVAAGRPYRHLDCEMLLPRVCANLLCSGSRDCELAVVDGCFAPSRQAVYHDHFCYLDGLCELLHLTGIAVIDVSKLVHGHLPERSPHVAGVILDCVTCDQAAARWKIEVESLWQVPVVAMMPIAAPLRAIVEQLPADVRPTTKLCAALGEAFREFNEPLLTSIADCEPPFALPQSPAVRTRETKIALGIDQSASRYFPENVELLTSRGGAIRDFSPFRTVELPRNCDIVYLGDGCLITHAGRLAANCCLLMALRAHVAAGGRIYAEGMGAAMLGRELILPNGKRLRMAGIVPWNYKVESGHASSQLQQIDVAYDNWLAEGCGALRGYAGCCRLSIAEVDENETCDGFATENATKQPTLRAWQGAVVSTMPLFFPAHPQIVTNLLRPARQYCATT